MASALLVLVVAPAIGASAIIQPEKVSFIEARLFNQSEGTVQVRVQSAGRDLFSEQRVTPQSEVTFRMERGNCRNLLQAWVNGRHYSRIQGNLCPENYPDEMKTIVILADQPPIAVGEDRD